MEAEVVPNKTLPVEAPKPFPAMVTVVPDCPTVGPEEPTSGAAALAVNCQTAAVRAPRVGMVPGLLTPDPAGTVITPPPSTRPSHSSFFLPTTTLFNSHN